jgi:hypothetical protein
MRKPTTDGEFWLITAMFYGGAALLGAGITGVTFYAPVGLALSIHGYLLWRRAT